MKRKNNLKRRAAPTAATDPRKRKRKSAAPVPDAEPDAEPDAPESDAEPDAGPKRGRPRTRPRCNVCDGLLRADGTCRKCGAAQDARGDSGGPDETRRRVRELEEELAGLRRIAGDVSGQRIDRFSEIAERMSADFRAVGAFLAGMLGTGTGASTNTMQSLFGLPGTVPAAPVEESTSEESSNVEAEE